MQAGGRTTQNTTHKGKGQVPLQRFMLVLEGTVMINQANEESITLGPNHFAFLPGSKKYEVAAIENAGMLVYERLVGELELPHQEILTGNVDSTPLLDTGVLRSCELSYPVTLHPSATTHEVCPTTCTSIHQKGLHVSCHMFLSHALPLSICNYKTTRKKYCTTAQSCVASATGCTHNLHRLSGCSDST
jgi:hypothetical protein